MLHLPALWYFDTSVMYPQRFRRVKFVVIPPRVVKQQCLWYIAIQPAVGCYSSWANLRCSSCSPLGDNFLWSGTIVMVNGSNQYYWRVMVFLTDGMHKIFTKMDSKQFSLRNVVTSSSNIGKRKCPRAISVQITIFKALPSYVPSWKCLSSTVDSTAKVRSGRPLFLPAA